MEADEVVGGRYRLVAPIASGGMGTVWRARHVELDSEVAVKVMSEALLRAPTALARFQREARAAAQLKSPHVVQVFDYGVHEGQPYLAMEILHGEDLKSYLDRLGALPLGRAAQILDALAKALRLAHAAGIVHRDLKPANIFLHQSGGDEIVKVLDFGIAKDLSPQPDALRTSTSTVVGSPLYMSPEQVRGSEVDHRTDLWSLAVVAFEMVTGRQPFEGASLGDVFARIVADRIPVASSVLAGLPPSVDAFFARALSRSPADRPASATELVESFRAAIEGDAAREGTTRVVPVLAAKVARDAPTMGDDAGTAALPPVAGAVTHHSSAPPPKVDHPSSAPARTAVSPEGESRDLELARTVATGAPSARPAAGVTAPRSSAFTRVAVVGAVLIVGAGGIALAPWREVAPPAGSPSAGSSEASATASPEDRPGAEGPSVPAPDVEPVPSGSGPASAGPSANAPAGAVPDATRASANPSASASPSASAAPVASPAPRPPPPPRSGSVPSKPPPKPPPSSPTDSVFGLPER